MKTICNGNTHCTYDTVDKKNNFVYVSDKRHRLKADVIPLQGMM